jgi:3-oxoacyl-[acyl-carrier-protein] synthase II
VERRRVVITGLGSVNPLAHSMAEAWTRLKAGESGVTRISRFDPAELGLETHIAGEVKDFDPTDYMDARAARRMDRFGHFAVAAGAEALRESGLVVDDGNRDRIGVLFATGVGGLQTIVEQENVRQSRGPKRVSPLSVPMLMPNAAAGNISMQHGIRGMGMALASACASSNDAIGMALAAIQLGWMDAVVTGGAEAQVVPLAIAGFNQAGALSTRYNDAPARASRPFDKDRDGFVIAEMGTALVLETLEGARRRGAPVWAELAGYGASMDAFHITAPAPDGNGAVRAMRAALDSAGVRPEEVDYISAHGTSTPINDPIETRAVKEVFGERAYGIPMSSVKSMVGHSAGGCGAFEAAALALSIADGIVPPTINYETPDPECDLDYVPNVARRVEIRAALSNTFGFGGHNSCLVLRRVQD